MIITNSINKSLELFRKKKIHPRLSIEGGFIYRIRLIGDVSPFLKFCIEETLLRAADQLGIGITFVNTDSCDLCVICGDTLLGNSLYEIYSISKRIQAPIISFGIGSEIDLNKLNFKDRIRLRRLFKRMHKISVRDEITANFLKNNLKLNNAEVIGEPIFGFRPLKIYEEKSNTKKYGFALINWSKNEELNNQVYQNIAQYCNKAIDKIDAQIHFYCFSRGQNFSDEDVALTIKNKIKNKNNVFIHPYTPDLLLSYSRLQEMDYIFSMRSTAGVVSLLCQKPAIVMEKRVIRGEEIFNSVNWDSFLITPQTINSAAINNLFELIEENNFSRLKQTYSLINTFAEQQNKFANNVFHSLFV